MLEYYPVIDLKIHQRHPDAKIFLLTQNAIYQINIKDLPKNKEEMVILDQWAPSKKLELHLSKGECLSEDDTKCFEEQFIVAWRVGK